MFMLNKELTIIAVTYNSASLIRQFLKEVAGKFEVIVVDNASRDDTCSIIESFHEVKLIRSPVNIGYGRAANLALREVKTDYSFLLNPDIITDYVEIIKLLEVAKAHQKSCVIAPATDKAIYDRTSMQSIELAEWVVGAAMLFNMKNLSSVGFFDEEIFLYYEETDLCKRILKSGQNILLCRSVLLEHLVGKSSAVSTRTEYLKSWHAGWSKLYYFKKHFSGSRYLAKKLSVIFKYLSKFIVYSLIFNRDKSLKYKARILGVMSFVFGRKAFDKNGNPRGIIGE